MNITEIHSRMKIPVAYRGLTLDDIDDRRKTLHIVPQVGELAQNKQNVIICSPTSGICKTLLSVGWLTAVRQSDFHFNQYDNPDEKLFYEPDRYRFIDCTDNPDFDMNNFDAPKIYRDLTRGARAIVLDDLGREGRFAPDWYMKIIYWAHSHGKPICVNSNMSIDMFIERYGENIRRRLLDNGVAINLKQGK